MRMKRVVPVPGFAPWLASGPLLFLPRKSIPDGMQLTGGGVCCSVAKSVPKIPYQRQAAQRFTRVLPASFALDESGGNGSKFAFGEI